MQHTLLFVYEPLSVQDDTRSKFLSAVVNWGNLGRTKQLHAIYGRSLEISPLTISQTNMAFEIRLTSLDELWVPSTISSKDLSIALEFDLSEWKIWRLF